jgi:hypothetical protein
MSSPKLTCVPLLPHKSAYVVSAAECVVSRSTASVGRFHECARDSRGTGGRAHLTVRTDDTPFVSTRQGKLWPGTWVVNGNILGVDVEGLSSAELPNMTKPEFSAALRSRTNADRLHGTVGEAAKRSLVRSNP